MSKNLFLKYQAQITPHPKAMEISNAKGVYIYDNNNKPYMDLVAGVSACTLGHRHHAVVKAIQQQVDNYMHVMVYGEYAQSPQYNLAKILSDNLPGNLNCTYFVNSGCEAIEGAMKLAKKYTGRSEFISCKDSYHGSSQGALSLMGTEKYKTKYRPLLPECNLIKYNCEESLKFITQKTAAVIIEPVQGATGFITPKNNWLQKIRKRCNDVEALLIFDEIQTGFGRTGKLFALDTYNVIPDILCLAKGMGGGMPIGAFISSKEKMDMLKENPKLGHITTFGGHPVCCSAALATLKVLLDEKEIITSIKKKEKLFRKQIQHSLIQEIRGIGLMLAIELGNEKKCHQFISLAYKKGLITFLFLFNKTAIRITPPLTISKTEIKEACLKINEILNEIN